MMQVLLVWSTNRFHEGLRPGLDDRDDVLQILTNADKKMAQHWSSVRFV